MDNLIINESEYIIMNLNKSIFSEKLLMGHLFTQIEGTKIQRIH